MDLEVKVDTTEATEKLEQLTEISRKLEAQRAGYKSSKFQLAVFGMVLIAALFVFVVIITKSAAGWGELCIAEVTFAATFSGTRVMESYAQARSANPPAQSSGGPS